MSAARALHRGIERHPLPHLPNAEVVALQLGQIAAAAKQGRRVALVASLGDDAVHERLDVGELGEVLVDVVSGLVTTDPKAIGQSEGFHSVEKAEVDRLRSSPHLGGNQVGWNRKDAGRSGGVDVGVGSEGFHQARSRGSCGRGPGARSGCSRRRGRSNPRAGRKPVGSSCRCRSEPGCSADWGCRRRAGRWWQPSG